MASTGKSRSGSRRPTTRTLADAAYTRLRDSIVTLRLAPGAPLTEVELCRRLMIARAAVGRERSLGSGLWSC